jgi:GNAT superfamily N-acetyltransferase
MPRAMLATNHDHQERRCAMCACPSVDVTAIPATILPGAPLANGAVVALRPARVGDAALLERMYFRLSPRTIYYRLFVGAPRVPDWACRFAAISLGTESTGVALVAVLGDDIIGTARFDRNTDCAAPSASAEVGIVVEDAWQGLGLGRFLLRRLADEALARGITTLTAHTLGENQRALRLFKGTFSGLRITFAEGEYAIVAPLLPAGHEPPSHPIITPTSPNC